MLKFRPTLEKPKAAHKPKPVVSDKDRPKDIHKQFLLLLSLQSPVTGVTPRLTAGQGLVLNVNFSWVFY